MIAEIRKFTVSPLQRDTIVTSIVTGGLAGSKRAEGRAEERGGSFDS